MTMMSAEQWETEFGQRIGMFPPDRIDLNRDIQIETLKWAAEMVAEDNIKNAAITQKIAELEAESIDG